MTTDHHDIVTGWATEAKQELVDAGVQADSISVHVDESTYRLTIGDVEVTRSETGWCYGPDLAHVDSTAALLLRLRLAE